MKLAESKSGELVAHLAGVMRCGSVWACPTCSAKVRAKRAEELGTEIGRWCAEKGGGAALVTLTLPHHAGDRLERMVSLVSDAFRALLSGKASMDERERFGIVGNVRAFEITHGPNGWHPHLHALVVTERPLDALGVAELQDRWQKRWNRYLERAGWAASKEGIGVRVDPVRYNAEAIGAYVAKVQEGSLGNELARGDLKRGREGRRTPFEILADFASGGDVDDLDLWHEYEKATKGRSAIRWSRGLRKRMGLGVEATDEELAAEEVGGKAVALIDGGTYAQVIRHPAGEIGLCEAAEAGGIHGAFAEVRAYVASLGIDPDGVTRPPDG